MANRKTRRNNQKNKKVEEKVLEATSSSTLNKVIIALLVICVLGLFYLLTVYITNKHSDKDTSTEETESTEATISYDKILIGKAFSMSDTDYLVLFYDTSNNDISSTYSDLMSKYKEKEDHLPIYYADMNNSFNKKYSTTEESNKAPTKAEELAINGPTLIKISNGGLVDYLEGKEAISGYLS